MKPTETRPVILPELSVYEHGILAHLGLTQSDIRVKCDGTLSGVHHRSIKKADKFAAKVRTHLGHAVVFTLTCTNANEAQLEGAVEMLLFTLAVQQIHIQPSAVFIATEDNSIRLTLCCDARMVPRIKHEVLYAAQFGCMSEFAPVIFEHKRMEKVSSLGTFPCAFMAAAAVALTSKVHINDHTCLMESTTLKKHTEAALVSYGTAPRVRAMLRDAQLASSAQYHVFWSSMQVE
jgi:hypothetical protein